jgi:tetratricopeptide (TPR) repeat protein
MSKPAARHDDEAPSRVQAPAWPDEWVRALGDASLRQASSAAIFQRGKAYATSGAVEVVNEDPMPEPALHAQVTGTETYTTEVWIEDDAVAGSCDCPNAEDGWFCKHQVAVALVWRDRLAGHAVPSDGSAPEPVSGEVKRARTAEEKRQALHDFLHGQEVTTLADKLLEFADRDHDIARELQQWRKASELSNDPAELKTLVNEMLAPGRSFIAWDESASFVRRAEAVLPLLEQARRRDAGAAAALCLHALRRAWGVLQQADDSDGEIGGLCQAIGAEWVLSLKAAGPQKASFGDTYLQVQLEDPFGCFDTAAAEAAIGEPAMTRYRSAIAERWRRAKDAVLALKAEHAAKVANRKGRAPVYERTSERDLSLWTLERLHLAQLEATGQVDEAVGVLREDLSDAHAHSKVVSCLEGHGRFREAFAQAEQGIKLFPDDWRLQDDLLRCYERDGWTAEALAMRRQQFERSPGVERYQLVLKAGQAAGQDVVALRQSLIDFLAGLELKAMNRPPYSARSGSVPAPTGQRDVSLRAEVLCAEGRWSEACALVQPPAVCRDGVLSQIARHLAPEQGDQALSLLLRVFNSAMRRSSSPYRDELAMVDEVGRRMDPALRTAWLAQLRTEFKAKRNFIRDLPER